MTDHDDAATQDLLETQIEDRRERDAQERVDDADSASQTALDSLSIFMREIVAARKLLSRPATPADAMLAAREDIKEPPP